MIHNQIHIPLSQILKACPFREHHAEHGVGIFHTAFLSASHRITIINAGTLDTFYTYFKCLWIAEFRPSVCKQIFKQREEFTGSKTFFHMVDNKVHSAFCTAVHQECQEGFFFREKEG